MKREQQETNRQYADVQDRRNKDNFTLTYIFHGGEERRNSQNKAMATETSSMNNH